MGKAAAIAKGKFLKAWKASSEGQAYIAIAEALYRYALTEGIANEFGRRQSTWEPLSPRYLAWKRRKGFSTRKWEMTGATLKALRNNPPENGKGRRKLQFGINFHRDLAFARPRAFRRRKGFQMVEMSNGEFQSMVFNSLRYGSVRAKAAAWEKKTGRSTDDARIGFSSTEGRMMPARPLMVWTDEIRRNAEKDVAEQMAALLKAAGIETKPGAGR